MGNAASAEQYDPDFTSSSAEQLHPQDDPSILASANGTHPANINARQNPRSQLYRCSAEELELQTKHTQHHSPQPNLSQQDMYEMEYTGTNTPQSPPNAKIDQVISILHEMKKSASPDELIALQRALMPSSTDILVPNPCSPTADKKKASKVGNMIRRRSFFTPGLATREQTPKTQQSSPISPQPRTQTWSTDMFGQSPLSKLAGWESKNNGHSERAVTPDIRHLGIHELGSLRVTNGAASPDPSTRPPLHPQPSLASIKREDDYFTASEGSGRDSPEKMSARSAESPGATASLVDSDTTTPTQARRPSEDAWASVAEFQPPPTDHSTSTDSRPSTRGSSDATLESISSYDPSLGRAASVLRPYHNEVTSNPFLSDSADPKASVSLLDLSQPRITSADGLYQNEANSNPFLSMNGDPDPVDEGFIGTSESTMSDYFDTREAGTDSMRAENNQSIVLNIAQYLRTASRAKAYDRLNGHVERDMLATPASSIYTAGSQREKREALERPKTDSGYHSESSLHTFKDATGTEEAENSASTAMEESQAREQNRLAARRAFAPTESNYHEGKHRTASTPTGIRAADLRKPLPRDPPLLWQRQPESSSHFSASHGTPNSQPPLTQVLSAPVKLSSPVSHVSPRMRVLPSPTQSPTSDSKKTTSGPKKLQKKKRPFSARPNSEPIIVQSQQQVQSNFSSLPQVPIEVSSRYTHRMTEHPDMEHLEKTFRSAGHCGSRDSFSSFLPFNIQSIRFPSPTRPSDDRSADSRGRGLRRSSLGVERRKRDIFRSKSRGRDETLNAGDEWPITDADAGVDFGTVAASLGSSPYDLASSSVSQGPKRSLHGPKGVMHPHQISSNLPRAKSAIGMSDQAASEFARLRSRDRLENLDGSLSDLPLRDAHGHVCDKPQALLGFTRPSNATYEPKTLGPPMRESTVRRKPVYGSTSADDQHDGTASPDRYYYSQSNERRFMPPEPLAQKQTQAADTEPNWETSARAWRLRRKSIGENLLQRPNEVGAAGGDEARKRAARLRRPPTPHSRSAPQTPADSIPAATWHPQESPTQKVQTNQQRKKTRPVEMNAEYPVRTSSPTPSVRERAAAFERGLAREATSGRQPPHRRPPSPLKSPVRGEPATREWLPPTSKFSVAPPSQYVAPSGVASAYTTYNSGSKVKSGSGDQDVPRLLAPRRRAWPTSAFPASR